MSILLRKSFKVICEQFDELMGGSEWRAHGLDSITLKKWCILWGHPFFFVSSGRLISIHNPPVKMGKAVACCIFDGHVFMYKSARCLHSWQMQEEGGRVSRRRGVWYRRSAARATQR